MTTIMEWSSVLAIDHGDIDNEHQVMVELLNKLHNALQTRNMVQVSDLLEQFSSAAMEHFAMEEQLMQELGYPHLQRHKAQHDELAERAQDLHYDLIHNNIPFDEKITEFLRDWMLDHILGEDRELGLFLQNR